MSVWLVWEILSPKKFSEEVLKEKVSNLWIALVTVHAQHGSRDSIKRRKCLFLRRALSYVLCGCGTDRH